THLHLQAFGRHYHGRTPRVREQLQMAQAVAQRAADEARRVIAGLRPAVLDDFGLEAALRQQLAALRHEGWEIEEQVSLGARRLPLTVETTLFRVAQEALTNVRKHAATTRVRVALRWQGATVRLEVRDWGRGFRPGAVVAAAAGPGERVGLASM